MSTRPKPIVVGAFRELGGDANSPSIRDEIGRIAQADRPTVAAYLDGGIPLTAVPGSDRDAIDGSVVVRSPSILTDGVHLWRRDLAHYVEKYGVGLQASILASIRAGHSPPSRLDDDRYSELAHWVARRLRNSM